MDPRTIYYAHPMSWYGTDNERADMQVLRQEWPGVEIINPSAPDIVDEFEAWKQHGQNWLTPMNFFTDLVKNSEALAYRPYRDGKVGAGVAQEILHAHVWGLPIYQLFSGCSAAVCSAPKIMAGSSGDLLWDTLTIAETRARNMRKLL